jgi:hypothetical protein
MNNKLSPVLYFLVAGLVSCGMRTTRLGDNITRIPKNTTVYKNRARFDSSVLKYFDTSVVYEEYNSWKGILSRHDSADLHGFYDIYRFYSNGFMNCFVIDRNKPLVPKEFDPEYNGYRGVYYKKGKKLIGELFSVINGMGQMGKIRERFIIKGDTLIKITGENRDRTLYVKRKLPPEYLIYTNPQWE